MLLFDYIRVKALTLQPTLPLCQDGSRQMRHLKQSAVFSIKNSEMYKCWSQILLFVSLLSTSSVFTRVALLSLPCTTLRQCCVQRLLCRAPVFCAPTLSAPILCTSVVLRALWCTKCKSVVAPAARPGDRPPSSSGNLSRSFFCIVQNVFWLPCRCQQVCLVLIKVALM